MNNFSTTGYKDDSPDRNNSHNIIPGNLITMKGVSKQLTLVPIINGKPQYDRKRVANPGDSDIQFEDDVEGVLEMPMGQVGLQTDGLTPPPSITMPAPPTYDAYMKGQQQDFNKQQVANNYALPSTPNAANVNMEVGANLGTDPELDANQSQQANAAITSEKVQNKKPFIGAINPYGSWNMNSASTALGAFIDAKNPLGIIGSAGKILLEGTRNALAGASAHKVYREGQQEYEDKLERTERRGQPEYRQKGGSVGHMLTGNFIEGDDNHPNPNTEVEKGEYLQTPDGATMEVMGDRHSTGGEMLELPGGTKVISDYIKIGAKNATFFKKEFSLNVKATSTFATVLDKYKKKIGLTELLEDEVKLMNKLNDQEDIEFEGTKEINLQVLSEKIHDIQPEKKELESLFENFTNVVFEKQEETKTPGGNNFEKQEGGQIEQPTIDENGQPIQQQEGQQQEGGSEIEQLIIMYCQITGQDPAQVIQQLQQLPEDQLQQAIEQISQTVQQAMAEQQGGGQPQEGQPQPQEGEPMMRNGGYFQPGGVTPFEGSDYVQKGNFIDDAGPRKMTQNGQEYYIYGEGNDTRMVPVSAVDNQHEIRGKQVDSPYKTSDWTNDEFTSDYQQNLKKEVQNRYDSAPTQHTSVSSDETKRIQQVLTDSGYDIGSAGIDGKLGAKTIEAARQMQAESPDTYKSWINVDLPQNEIAPVETAPVQKGNNSATQIIRNNQTPKKNVSSGSSPVSKVIEQKKPVQTRERVNSRNIDRPADDGYGVSLQKDPITQGLLSTLTFGASSLLPGGAKMIESRGKDGKMQTLTGVMDAIPLVGSAISKSFSTAKGINDMKQIITAGNGVNNATKVKYAEKLLQVANSTKTPLTKSQLNMVNFAEAFLKGNKTTKQLPFMNNINKGLKNPFLEPYLVNKTVQMNDNFRNRNYKQEGGFIEYAQNGIITKNADGTNSYSPRLIPSGKSQFGAVDVANEIYNPASEVNIQAFLDDARTTNLWNSDYNTNDLETRLKNAKTQKEKFDILNTEGQRTRQGAFLKNATNELASYVGMGYAPVQTQLQKVYDTLPDNAKKQEFSKVLKESGWGIDKGKVFGGNYKYNSQYKEGDKLYDFLNTKVDPKLVEEIGIQNINDGVYDRRRERFESAEFNDQKSMDDFATKHGFKTFQDKSGRTVWVDPRNRNNIILPTMKGKPTPADPSTPAVAETTPVQKGNDIGEMGNLDKNWDDSLPILAPDQSNLRPNFLQPGLRTYGHVQANAINISPEETLKELNKQYITASKLSSETNPYTSGAMQADLQAKSNIAINQAYSQAALANAQDERNVENTNEGRIQQRENSNIGAMNQFEELSQKALDNYGQSWRNYYTNQNLENVNNWNLENQRQAFNATNDNFKIGANGWYQTGETPIIQLQDGTFAKKDPSTGQYTEVKVEKDENGRVKKTTEKSGTKPPRKQKGGLLLNKGIRNYLK